MPLLVMIYWLLFIVHLVFLLLFMNFMSSSFVLELVFGSFDSLVLSFVLIFDWVSCGFVSLVFLISFVVFIYNLYYMAGDIFIKRFNFILFLFVISMFMLILGSNLFMIMIGWDGLGVVSFLLVIYYYNNISLISGLLTVLMNRLGDLSLIYCFYLMMKMGSWDHLSTMFSDWEFSFVFYLMFVISAITKSAQIPFSSWLPAAMAAPTPVSSLVHSSTLVTAGVYIIIRFYSCFSVFILSEIFFFISSLTCFFSGIMAFFELDMKKIIAMSTLSQLGLMFLSLSSGEWIFGYFHMMSHALFKALLFLSCGSVILDSWGNQDFRLSGGKIFISPFFSMVFLSSSLNLMGFPFLSGFYSKDFIIEYLTSGGYFLLMILVLFFSCLLTFAYSFRVLMWGIWGDYMSNVVLGGSKSGVLFGGIIFIYVWSILFGYFMGEFMFFDFFFILTFSFKKLGVLVLFLGAIWWYFKMGNLMGKMKFFVNEMFFLAWFFGYPVTKMTVSFKSDNVLDLLWVEYLGPAVVFICLDKLGEIFFFLFKKSFKIVFFYLGIMILFMIIL